MDSGAVLSLKITVMLWRFASYSNVQLLAKSEIQNNAENKKKSSSFAVHLFINV